MRQLRFIEIADESVRFVRPSGSCGLLDHVVVNEKRIKAIALRARLGSLHLQPPSGSAARVRPGVAYARTDQSEVARTEHVALLTDLRLHRPFQDIEAFFQ